MKETFFYIHLKWKRLSDWRIFFFIYILSENEYRTEGTFFNISWVNKNIGLKEHFFIYLQWNWILDWRNIFFLYIYLPWKWISDWMNNFFFFIYIFYLHLNIFSYIYSKYIAQLHLISSSDIWYIYYTDTQHRIARFYNNMGLSRNSCQITSL